MNVMRRNDVPACSSAGHPIQQTQIDDAF
jgi:hypothetical protein